MKTFRRSLAAFLVCALIGWAIPTSAQSLSTQIQIAINNLITGITTFTTLRITAGNYLLWGTGSGASGYGFRDNSGTIQVQNSGGSWANIVTGSTLPTNASFITRVPEGALTNETALSGLVTALLVNTTSTGVPTAYAGTACTNQFPRSLSAVGAATCATVSLTADVTGALPIANGGSGLTSGTSGGILGFTGSTTLASSVALTANELVIGGGAGATPTPLGALGTTTTLLHGNASGTPSFGAVSLTADVSGILPGANGGSANGFFAVSGPTTSLKTFTFPNATATVLTDNAAVTPAQGGTGISSYTTGDLPYASGSTTISALADVATGSAVISGGIGVAPTYGKIGLTTHVTGTLAVGNGGTGLASYTTGDIPYASSGSTLASLADSTAGKFLRAAGAGIIPAYSTTIWTNSATTGDVLYASSSNTYANLADVSVGSFLRSGGVTTAPVWSTTTIPNSATQGDLLYASAANVYANLNDVATGQVLVSGGVSTAPAYSASPVVTNLTTGTVKMTGGVLLCSATAPTISSGFGTSPAIPANNGTCAFTVNVGTGGTASAGVVGLPTATTGWVCTVTNRTGVNANRGDQHTVQTASATTTATFQNQTISTGAALAWTASDVLSVSCGGF